MKSWSYSALNQFNTCPAQFAAERIYRTIKRSTNAQAEWGIRVHDALEKRLREKIPLPLEFSQYEKHAVMVEETAGDKFYEHEIALTKDRKVTRWDADDVWVRAIFDVLVVHNNWVHIRDWKTGKVKDNTDQLKLFALCVFAMCPKVNLVHTYYNWIVHDKETHVLYRRDQIEELWEPFLGKVGILEEAFQTDIWVPRPSGLCIKHCDHTQCEYHGRGNRRY